MRKNKIISEDKNIIKCQYDSSNIGGSEYNIEKKELLIDFNNKVKYLYEGVTDVDYLHFEASKSQGKAFHKYIKKYDYKRVE